jgi:hypothetical protein
MMYTHGINAAFDDSSACIVKNGQHDKVLLKENICSNEL